MRDSDGKSSLYIHENQLQDYEFSLDPVRIPQCIGRFIIRKHT